MSTAGTNNPPQPQPQPQPYFCHQCNQTVTLTPLPNSDISCPICNSGFIEELTNPNPNPNPNPSLLDPFTFFSDPHDLSFNPSNFLQTYLQGLSSRGSNVQIVIENHPSGSPFQLPANIGDYFLGSGLENLIQQLADNDPNRYGTPPASKKAVNSLSDFVITSEVVNSDSNSCAVCMNEFEVNTKAKEMPCKHFFHSECLLPWLDLHNSCPVCRHELPTDDPDYERRRAGTETETRGGDEGEGGGGNVTQRSFRISLPWPLNLLGGSNGSDNDNNNNSGEYSGGANSSSMMDLD